MIIIADSGSTKVDWRVIYDDASVEAIVTEGINPVYQSRDEIINIIWNQLLMKMTVSNDVRGAVVHFYGAGVISSDFSGVVGDSCRTVFPNVELTVESDMLAASRALFGHRCGIASILGTGSNSCFYDGKWIAGNVKAGGFILGDEGSGAYLGKILVGDYVKGLVPKTLAAQLKERYQLSYENIVRNVYREQLPSRYLANFAYFIKEHQEDVYVDKLLHDAFGAFFDRNIAQYDYQKYEIGLIGSVAEAFEDIIRECAAKRNMKVGKVMQSPGDGLVEFHKCEMERY